VADTTNPEFTPTGDVVSWVASVAGGTFTPSSPIKCTLDSSAQCVVTYRSPSAASITISAHYQGDGTGQTGHQASDGSFILNATAATQTTASNASANYSLQDQTVALSATVTSNSVVNAGTVTFTVKNSSNATIGSVVTSGTVSAGSASANFTLPANTPTGTYSISAAYSGATGFAASSDSTHTLTVGQANQTITFGALAGKTYGDPDFTVTATASSGLPVSFSSLTTGICTVSGNLVHIVANGTCTIRSSQAGDTNWNAASNVDQGFTVGKKLATWTTNTASKTYGDADPDPLTTGSGSGFLAPDGIGATYARAAGETVLGGPYHITATLSATVAGALDNYTITNTGADFAINTRLVTVTPSSGQNKIYGADDPVLTYGITSGNLIGTDTFTGTLSRDSGQNVGLYEIVGGSLTLGSNYQLTITAGVKFEIKARPITVTADDKSKVYGDPEPALTFTVGGNGLAYTDTLTSSFTGVLTRAAGESVLGGPYAITQGTLAANSNYLISSFTPGKLSITPAALSITPAGGKTKVYGDPFTSFTGTPTGLKFQDAVNVTYASPGSALNASVGSYDITVAAVAFSTGAASNYSIATGTASNGLVVTQRPITIIADAKSKAYLAPDPAFTYHISLGNLVNGDTFTGNLTRVSGELPGTYAILQPTVALSPNYSLSYTGASLTIGYGQCSAAIGPGNAILPPINSDGTSVYQRKGGSTIPVKFRVCDYQGNSISNPAAAFAGTGGPLRMLSAVRGTVTVVNEEGATDIPDVAFRWSGDQWIFNMATSNLTSGNSYQFRINLAYGNIVFVVGVK